MKRSEMLQLIGNEISSFRGYNEATRNDMYVAKAVLNLIENQGMAPPEVKERSWTMLPDGQMIYEFREWEEE